MIPVYYIFHNALKYFSVEAAALIIYSHASQIKLKLQPIRYTSNYLQNKYIFFKFLHFQVLKTQYNGNKKLKFLGKEVIGVEKHLSCHCGCKVKEEVARAVFIFNCLTLLLSIRPFSKIDQFVEQKLKIGCLFIISLNLNSFFISIFRDFFEFFLCLCSFVL